MNRRTLWLGLALGLIVVAGLAGCAGTVPTSLPTARPSPPLTLAPTETPRFVVVPSTGGPPPTPPTVKEIVVTPKPTIPPAIASATAQAASTSGDSLVYLRGGRLWTMRADGRGQRELPLQDPKSFVLSALKNPGKAWIPATGDKIAYLVGETAALWIMNVDGSGNHLVADSLLLEKDGADIKSKVYQKIVMQEIAWTADGKRLAYLGAPDGQVDLYVADADKGNPQRLTNDDLDKADPVWSPDGKRIAFRATAPNAAISDLLIINADGSGRVAVDDSPIIKTVTESKSTQANIGLPPVWLDNETVAFYPEVIIGQSQGKIVGIWKARQSSVVAQPILIQDIVSPTWSAEARRWAFARRGDTDQIWTVSTAGGEPTVVASGQASSPVWSPDGSLILYSKGERAASSWDLYVVRPDGSGSKLLAQGVRLSQDGQPGPEAKRYWSPKGDAVVYIELGPALENVWVVGLDGSPLRQLTDFEPKEAFYIRPPLWSPDGKSLAFVGFSYVDQTLHLWTVGKEGGNLRRLDAGFYWFTWVPAALAAR